jgi:hypothetical protein
MNVGMHLHCDKEAKHVLNETNLTRFYGARLPAPAPTAAATQGNTVSNPTPPPNLRRRPQDPPTPVPMPAPSAEAAGTYNPKEILHDRRGRRPSNALPGPRRPQYFDPAYADTLWSTTITLKSRRVPIACLDNLNALAQSHCMHAISIEMSDRNGQPHIQGALACTWCPSTAGTTALRKAVRDVCHMTSARCCHSDHKSLW